MAENKCCVKFSWFVIVFFSFLEVLIIRKWLMNDSGHIPILFRTFLELPENVTKYRPSDPLFITGILQNILKETWKYFMKILVFVNLGI